MMLITIEPVAVNSNGAQYAALDHLGTPRVMTNSGGSVVSRHDYMPFGEELPAGIGGRTTAMGFSNAGDTNRKKFTGYEADDETGLNFAQARYQSPVQGRFTSVDPLGRSANVLNPQSFNRYSYVNNNPVNSVDPSGLALIDVNSAEEQHDKSVEEAIGLKAFNDAFNSGDMNAARSILAANPSIGYEMNSSYNPNAEGTIVSAEVIGVAGEPQNSGSLIPDKTTNPEDYNMMAVLLGEATPWGMVGRSNEYSLDQSRKSVKEAGAPAGPLITEDTAMKEMIFMVSAVINRMGDRNSGNSIPKIAASGAFNGYEQGKSLLENGGAPRRQMAFARAAIDFVRGRGSVLPENVQYWKAVRQGNGIRPWREGIDYRRVGMTDFSTRN